MKRILILAATAVLTPILTVAVCVLCHWMMTGLWTIDELGETSVMLLAAFATIAAVCIVSDQTDQ